MGSFETLFSELFRDYIAASPDLPPALLALPVVTQDSTAERVRPGLIYETSWEFSGHQRIREFTTTLTFCTALPCEGDDSKLDPFLTSAWMELLRAQLQDAEVFALWIQALPEARRQGWTFLKWPRLGSPDDTGEPQAQTYDYVQPIIYRVMI